MKGRLKDLTIGLHGEQNVTVTIATDWREEYARLKDTDVDIKIEKHRKLRSLDANAYAWVLMGKLAQRISPPLDKSEVYQLMLQRYGQGGMVSIRNDMLDNMLRAFDYWQIKGHGEVHGKEFTHVQVWVGSSKYDTKEMSVFIEGIVSECKELGIDTDTPEQIAEFMRKWGNK